MFDRSKTCANKNPFFSVQYLDKFIEDIVKLLQNYSWNIHLSNCIILNSPFWVLTDWPVVLSPPTLRAFAVVAMLLLVMDWGTWRPWMLQRERAPAAVNQPVYTRKWDGRKLRCNFFRALFLQQVSSLWQKGQIASLPEHWPSSTWTQSASRVAAQRDFLQPERRLTSRQSSLWEVDWTAQTFSIAL